MSHEHDADCPAMLRELRDIKREAREERKEMREEIKGLRFELVNLGKDVAALKVKTGIWGVVGGGGMAAILKLLKL